MEKIVDRENKTILECLRKVIAMYNSQGFIIKLILGDGEFRYMIDTIMTNFKCHPNYTAAREHVLEVERAV